MTGPADNGRSANEDETALVRALASGDREALGTLYDRLAPGMLAVAARILGSSQEAEDLVQDVFLELWHRARHYDPARGSVRTWVMLRLRSRAIDHHRKAERNRKLADDDASGLREPAFTPDAGAGADGAKLAGVLAELPAEQRTVIELSYFGGHSCSELAALLKLPVGTIKSRMSRAIARLRARLHYDEGAC